MEVECPSTCPWLLSHYSCFPDDPVLFLGSWPVILNAPAPYHPLESAVLQPCLLKLGAQIVFDTQVPKLQKGKMGDMILQGSVPCAFFPQFHLVSAVLPLLFRTYFQHFSTIPPGK